MSDDPDITLDAIHGRVRLAVADLDYATAQRLLAQARSDHPDQPPERWVSVAPDVLGPGVSLEGDDEEDVTGAATFTVVSPEVERAAAAVARVAPQLMDVDEHGNVFDPGAIPTDEVFTPTFLSPVEVCAYAAVVGLDTDGVMFSGMGRTMVGILVAGLAADGVPAHIAGYRPDLRGDLRIWQASETG
jgi:hypothetical protein